MALPPWLDSTKPWGVANRMAKPGFLFAYLQENCTLALVACHKGINRWGRSTQFRHEAVWHSVFASAQAACFMQEMSRNVFVGTHARTHANAHTQTQTQTRKHKHTNTNTHTHTNKTKDKDHTTVQVFRPSAVIRLCNVAS